jgi:hypothetical protein
MAFSLFFALQFPLNAFAKATILIDPHSFQSAVGDKVKVNFILKTDGQSAYTVESNIRFSSDLLMLDTWTFADTWIPLRQPVYDKLDNVTGVLVRTAGFPSGAKDGALFGTATFITKKTGKANISLDVRSFILDNVNQNDFVNPDSVTVTIAQSSGITVSPAPLPVAMDINFQSTLLKDSVPSGEPVVIMTKIENQDSSTTPINASLNSVLYDTNGQQIKNTQDNVNILTRSDVMQHFDISDLASGRYSIITELVYPGQSEPQKETLEFTVLPKTAYQQYQLLWWVLIILVVVIMIVSIAAHYRKKRRHYR